MPEDRHGKFLPSPHACLMPCHGSVDAMHCGNCFGKYAHQIHIQNENIPYWGDEHTRFKWVHDLLMHSWNGLLLEIADIHRHTMRRSNEWCWCNRNRTQTHTKSTNTNIYTHLMRVLPIEWAWATANLFVLCESRLFTFYPCHIINSFLLRGKVVLLGVFGVCLSHAFIHVRCASCHLAVVGLRCGLPMCWHWLFWDVPERASSIDTHNADSATNTQLASIECNCSLLTFGFVGYTGVSSVWSNSPKWTENGWTVNSWQCCCQYMVDYGTKPCPAERNITRSRLQIQKPNMNRICHLTAFGTVPCSMP